MSTTSSTGDSDDAPCELCRKVLRRTDYYTGRNTWEDPDDPAFIKKNYCEDCGNGIETEYMEHSSNTKANNTKDGVLGMMDEGQEPKGPRRSTRKHQLRFSIDPDSDTSSVDSDIGAGSDADERLDFESDLRAMGYEPSSPVPEGSIAPPKETQLQAFLDSSLSTSSYHLIQKPSISAKPFKPNKRQKITVAAEPNQPKLLPLATSSFYNNLGATGIDLVLGISTKRFHIHTTLLINKSAYFDKLLKYNPYQNSYSCPEIEPQLFSFVFEWLYRGTITGLDSIDNSIIREHTNLKIDIYCLAAKLQMIDLKNVLISHIGHDFANSEFWPTVEQIRRAYAGTNADVGLRHYMALSYRYLLLRQEDPQRSGDIHKTNETGDEESKLALTLEELGALMDLKDLQTDVFALLRGMMTSDRAGKLTNPKKEAVCAFHEHSLSEAEGCPFKGLKFGSRDGRRVGS